MNARSKNMRVSSKNITSDSRLLGWWHPVKNGTLQPCDVSLSSNRVVWWKCNKGHEWDANVHNSVTRKGCPLCLGLRPSAENNLRVIYPAIAEEWHSEKNGDLTPKEVLSGSHKRVWWKCKFGHEWITDVQSRTAKGSNCPKCRLFGASRFEVRVFSELKSIWTDSESKSRIGRREGDVVIPSLCLVVEIDGYWWHKDSSARDALKTKELAGMGFNVIRLRESPLPLMSPSDLSFQEGVYRLDQQAHEVIQKLVQIIGKIAGCDVSKYLSADSFANQQEYEKLLCNFSMPSSGKSLKDLFPHIAEQWHPTKNGIITPDRIKPMSNRKVWWRCEKGHEWKTHPLNRTHGKGCPFCSGQARCFDNSIVIRNPQIAKQWHPTKNGTMKPEDIGTGSAEKVWWKCECGNEWKAVVKERCRTRSCGCSVCAHRHHSERMKGNGFRLATYKARV